MDSLRDRVIAFLRHRNIRLNTDLGQHFLVDEEILEQIVTSADITSDDHIVEIGPGIGVLTSELLKHAARVTAIELDERFIPLLKNFVTNHTSTSLRASYSLPTTHLDIIHGNALQTDFPATAYKIVANIPYHITSPLLRHAYLESPTAPTAMTLLIQREVAEKICDEEHAGILTIMVKLFGTPKIICKVPPSAFLPPPAVDSAVLQIVSHAKPLADRPTIDQILKLLKIAFAGKRKMLRNTLGGIDPPSLKLRWAGNGLELLAKAGIDPTRRPETVTVQEWIRLAKIDN